MRLLIPPAIIKDIANIDKNVFAVIVAAVNAHFTSQIFIDNLFFLNTVTGGISSGSGGTVERSMQGEKM